MEKSWKITLSDGTQLENLGLSGNNFVSETEITEDMFENKLSKVIVEGTEEGNQVRHEYEQMELVQIVKYENGYYFVLRELSQDELDKREIQDVIKILLAGEEI